jgi:hypothetical protein
MKQMRIKLPLIAESVAEFVSSDVNNLFSIMPFKVKVEDKKDNTYIIKAKFLDYEGPIKVSINTIRTPGGILYIEATFDGETSVGMGLVGYKEKVTSKLALEAIPAAEGVELTISVSYSSPYEKEREKELEKLFTKFVESFGENIVKYYASRPRPIPKKEEKAPVIVSLPVERYVSEKKEAMPTQPAVKPEEKPLKQEVEARKEKAIKPTTLADRLSSRLGDSSFVLQLLDKSSSLEVEITKVTEAYLSSLINKVGSKDSFILISCKRQADKLRAIVGSEGILGIWAEIGYTQYLGMEALEQTKDIEFTCASYVVKGITI